MANFIRVNNIASASIAELQANGTDVMNQGNVYKFLAGALSGNVYIGRIGNSVYALTIGSGYSCTWWWSDYANDEFPQTTNLVATTFQTVYAGYLADKRIAWNWTQTLTDFSNTSEMYQAFYSDYVSPEEEDTIVVRVTATDADEDDNDEGGISGPNTGEAGTFDDSSDIISLDPLPSINAVNTGLVNIFRPSLAELQSLGNYMWTNIGDIPDNFKKLFSNPIESIIAFHIMPVFPDVGPSQTIKLGLWETNTQMSPVLSQWYEKDFGIISIEPYWGSALDYAPYTKISIFLPFIGSVQLNTDEVMASEIHLRYRFDLLTGQCVAIIATGNSHIYQFTGECGVTIPITSADWSRVYQAAIGAIGAVAVGATGIVGAATATAGGLAGQTASIANASQSVAAAGDAFANVNATSKGVKGVTAMREQLLIAAERANASSAQVANGPTRRSSSLKTASAIIRAVDNVAGNVMGAKAIINHSGNISGSVGLIGVKTPYVLIEYPNQSLAQNYKHFVGYPSNIYSSLSNLTGYTECESVIVEGIHATDDEIAEITEALKSGVYL